jgi:hypothetical protein
MLSTGKRATEADMKKAVLAICICLLSFTSVAQEVSALELKSMQSRKIKKPFREITDAITLVCRDAGGTPQQIPAQVIEDSATRHPGLKGLEGKTIVKQVACKFPPDIKIGFFGGISDANKVSNVHVDLEKIGEDGSVLRARLYKGIPRKQIADPAAYSNYFQMIGDALFVQAIDMEPVEQN